MDLIVLYNNIFNTDVCHCIFIITLKLGMKIRFLKKSISVSSFIMTLGTSGEDHG